jgi:hypothetical protein
MDKLQTRFIVHEFHPFYSCCQESAEMVQLHEEELDVLMKETEGREMSVEESRNSIELQHYLHMNEVTAPIFGVTAAENFIYYYGMMSLSSSHPHTVEHLEKLDTFTKWLVIPALACGTELDKSCNAMNEFHQLIQIRNSIIHPKSKIINNFTAQQVENAGVKIEYRSKKMRTLAKRAPYIFLALVEELLKVDTSETPRKIVADLALPIKGIEPSRTL